MPETTSLLDWILDLLRDPEARAQFERDPEDYARDHGFENLSAADVNDALCLISDNQSAGYDHGGGHGGGHIPPPPPPRHDDHDGDGPTYLKNYVTNNYTSVEEHETTIDNSVHQKIDTDGGDFDQVIDNDPVVASGDGSIAAGGDIEDSTLTTGDGNVVGDDNQAITGDDNTTAFGSGDATSADLRGTNVDDGGALSVGGDASGHSEDNDTSTSVRSSGDGDTSVNAAGDQGYADQDSDQSYRDDSEHTRYEDNSRTDSHDDVNSNNDTRYEDTQTVDIG